MSAERNIAYVLAFRTEDGQRAFAVADVNAPARRVVADIIRVPASADSLQSLQRLSVYESDRAVAAVCDNDPAGLRDINYPLRLVEPVDGRRPLALLEINHFQRVVSQSRHEKPLSFEVNGHVINAATHLRKWDAADEAEQPVTCPLFARRNGRGGGRGRVVVGLRTQPRRRAGSGCTEGQQEKAKCCSRLHRRPPFVPARARKFTSPDSLRCSFCRARRAVPAPASAHRRWPRSA